jgi:hypothetical protein
MIIAYTLSANLDYLSHWKVLSSKQNGLQPLLTVICYMDL